MRSHKLSFTMRSVLIFGVLLFAANTVLGLVVLNQSKTAMRTLINRNMLDVVEAAAGSLDGDALGALTEADVDGPVFRDIEDKLLVFQNNVDIEYIYAVKRTDDGRFVFTVDPDPVDPGKFGEEIVTTNGLIQAATGIPTADDSPAADRWGNFYSAFAPVFDSSGKVAGIVGVDFGAEWYDAQIRQYTVSITIVTSASVLIGALVVILISTRVRTKFKMLHTGLEELSKDMDVLVDEMTQYSGADVVLPLLQEGQIADASDELELLSNKIHNIQIEMGMYLEYLHSQAYTDSLTQLGNSTAYHEAIDELRKKIAAGTADFCVVVLDINGLKQLNDTYGHECGDYYIRGAAAALKQGYADAKCFRIGGDEFAVIAEGYDARAVADGLEGVAAAIGAFNESSIYEPELVVSKGSAHFVPGQDTTYEAVFSRADQQMYEDKRAYYRGRGLAHDRRHRFNETSEKPGENAGQSSRGKHESTQAD